MEQVESLLGVERGWVVVYLPSYSPATRLHRTRGEALDEVVETWWKVRVDAGLEPLDWAALRRRYRMRAMRAHLVVER